MWGLKWWQNKAHDSMRVWKGHGQENYGSLAQRYSTFAAIQYPQSFIAASKAKWQEMNYFQGSILKKYRIATHREGVSPLWRLGSDHKLGACRDNNGSQSLSKHQALTYSMPHILYIKTLETCLSLHCFGAHPGIPSAPIPNPPTKATILHLCSFNSLT